MNFMVFDIVLWSLIAFGVLAAVVCRILDSRHRDRVYRAYFARRGVGRPR